MQAYSGVIDKDDAATLGGQIKLMVAVVVGVLARITQPTNEALSKLNSRYPGGSRPPTQGTGVTRGSGISRDLSVCGLIVAISDTRSVQVGRYRRLGGGGDVCLKR